MNTPTLKCLLLCQEIVQDRVTGLFSLINVFFGVNGETYPQVVHPYTVFVVLEDVMPPSYRVGVSFLLEDADGPQELYTGDAEFPVSSAKTDHVCLHMPPLIVPIPGEYCFEVRVNGNLVGRHKFDAALRSRQ